MIRYNHSNQVDWINSVIGSVFGTCLRNPRRRFQVRSCEHLFIFALPRAGTAPTGAVATVIKFLKNPPAHPSYRTQLYHSPHLIMALRHNCKDQNQFLQIEPTLGDNSTDSAMTYRHRYESYKNPVNRRYRSNGGSGVRPAEITAGQDYEDRARSVRRRTIDCIRPTREKHPKSACVPLALHCSQHTSTSTS